MDNIVTLAQYDNFNTFGIQSMRDVEELNKALEAGYEHPPATGGSALRVESLENSLKVLTHKAKHCVFWNKIGKVPAYSTVEEYNQLLSVGSDANGAFIPEGTMPEYNDSGYARQVELVKFLGTTRQVTHQMTLVKSVIADVITQENSNGILWLLKQLEWALFNGDADMCFNGTASGTDHREWVEFNGLDKLIDPTMEIDLKGADLEEAHIDDAAQMIASNYGTPTDMLISFAAHKKFSERYKDAQRVTLSTSNDGYSVGVVVKEKRTPFGDVALNPDVFINPGKTPPSSGVTGAPTAPASFALDSTPMTGTDGVWGTHGGAGVYSYAVTAVNRFGESAAVNIGADLTVAAGDVAKHAVLKITNAASVTVAPEYFNIYKTVAGGSIKYLVARVRAGSQSNNGVTTVNDTGKWMANTTKAYLGEFSPDILTVKQLAPLMKMDLAILAPAIRWMILIYLTFLLYAPKKWVRLINIAN